MGERRVGTPLVRRSLFRNAARAEGNTKWASEGRSVATHEKIRSAANQGSMVALNFRVRREGRAGGRNMNQNNILLGLHTGGLA